MRTSDQISRPDDGHGIEITQESGPHEHRECIADASQTAREPESLGAPNPPRSALIASNLQLALTLLALFLSLFVAALDFSIATTATPTIVNELHSATIYTWIGSAYLLSTAAATPVWAKLSDIWGRKIILLVAVVTFAVGSAVCAASKSMGVLITGRSIQGFGAGGMIILTNICISDLFSMRHRGFYLGLVGLVWSLAGGIGPLLGGAITQYVSWRWNWWINLPISAVSFLTLCIYLRVHNPKTRLLEGMRAVDWLGIFLVLGMSVMVLLGLNLGGVISPWNSPRVICLVAFGTITSLIFISYEAKLAKNPLVPMKILRKRSTTASILVCFMHGFVNVSSWYFLPLYFQSVKEKSPLQSGILILPITFVQSMVSVAAGAIIHRTGRYLELIWIGMAITSIGFGLFIRLDIETPLIEIIFVEIIAGVGVGLVFQPLQISLQSSVDHGDVAAATALMGFIRSLSTAISIVIGGVIFQNRMDAQSKHTRSVLPPELAGNFSGDSAAANVNMITALSPLQKSVVKDSYARSLSSMWILYTAVAGLGLALSMFISRQELSTEHVKTRTGLQATDTKERNQTEEQ